MMGDCRKWWIMARMYDWGCIIARGYIAKSIRSWILPISFSAEGILSGFFITVTMLYFRQHPKSSHNTDVFYYQSRLILKQSLRAVYKICQPNMGQEAVPLIHPPPPPFVTQCHQFPANVSIWTLPFSLVSQTPFSLNDVQISLIKNYLVFPF